MQSIKAFPDFYAHYPNKKGRADAEKAWAQCVKSGAITDENLPTVIAAVLAQKRWRERAGQLSARQLEQAGVFVPAWPHPATWLRQQRWRDELEALPGMAPPSTSSSVPAAHCAGDGCEAPRKVGRYCSRCYTRLFCDDAATLGALRQRYVELRDAGELEQATKSAREHLAEIRAALAKPR